MGVDFLSDLPPEIGLHILSYVDTQTVWTSVKRVSKVWNVLASDGMLWKRRSRFPDDGRSGGSVQDEARVLTSSLPIPLSEWEDAYLGLATSFARPHLLELEAVSVSSVDINASTGKPMDDQGMDEMTVDSWSFWSSSGSVVPDLMGPPTEEEGEEHADEWVVFHFEAEPICAVTRVAVHPFKAYFQESEPVYGPIGIRVYVGSLLHSAPMRQENGDEGSFSPPVSSSVSLLTSPPLIPPHDTDVVHVEVPERGPPGTWSYVSPIICVLPGAEEISIPITPALAVGDAVKIEFLGKQTAQPTDGKFYTSIRHVCIEGVPVGEITSDAVARGVLHGAMLRNGLEFWSEFAADVEEFLECERKWEGYGPQLLAKLRNMGQRELQKRSLLDSLLAKARAPDVAPDKALAILLKLRRFEMYQTVADLAIHIQDTSHPQFVPLYAAALDHQGLVLKEAELLAFKGHVSNTLYERLTIKVSYHVRSPRLGDACVDINPLLAGILYAQAGAFNSSINTFLSVGHLARALEIMCYGFTADGLLDIFDGAVVQSFPLPSRAVTLHVIIEAFPDLFPASPLPPRLVPHLSTHLSALQSSDQDDNQDDDDDDDDNHQQQDQQALLFDFTNVIQAHPLTSGLLGEYAESGQVPVTNAVGGGEASSSTSTL